MNSGNGNIPECPSSEEWINKKYGTTHTMKYHATIKRIKIDSSTTCMSTENILLNERSQSSKTTYYMIPCRESVQNRQFQR